MKTSGFSDDNDRLHCRRAQVVQSNDEMPTTGAADAAASSIGISSFGDDLLPALRLQFDGQFVGQSRVT